MTTLNTLRDIAVEEIAPGYNLAQYLGFSLLIKMENGYVNATHLCKQSEKKKEFFNWSRLDVAKETIDDLASSLHRRRDELTEVPTGLPNELRGTYVHPHLVPVIAQWCSPKFRNRVAIILEDMAIREYKYKLAEANKEVVDLKHVMEQQNKKIDNQIKIMDEMKYQNDNQKKVMDEMKHQNDEQSRQIQELLGYAKDTKSTLDETKSTLERTEAKLDVVVDATIQARDDLDIIHHKVDDVIDTVSEQLVVPPEEASRSTSFVLVQIGKTTFKCIRRQKKTIKTTIATLKHDYPKAEVVEEFSYPNSINFLVRLKEYLRKNTDIPLKARYQTITGDLDDVKRVVSVLLDEQRKIDGLSDIKVVAYDASDKLDKAVV